MRLSSFICASSVILAQLARALPNAADSEGLSRDSSVEVEKRDAATQQQWYLYQDHSGENFFKLWNFRVGVDFQNWGSVLWASQQEAATHALTYINSAGNAILKVDNTTTGIQNDAYNSSYVGRYSLYMTTERSYQEGSLLLFSARHMPYGCGLWPGFWSMGGTADNWPQYGEIDIVEQVNMETVNQYSLHTTQGCQHPAPNVTNTSGQETGDVQIEYDCYNKTLSNSGCIVKEAQPNNYGAGFAKNGGGAYALLWTYDAISFYFFPRDKIPADFSSSSPDPSGWGLPSGYYPRTSCDFSQHFGNQHVVLDIDICGLYAGSHYVFTKNDLCTGKCTDLMPDPRNFDTAYFEIEFIRMFANSSDLATQLAKTTLPPNYSQSSPSTLAKNTGQGTSTNFNNDGIITPENAARSRISNASPLNFMFAAVVIGIVPLVLFSLS